jgi:hypothetical protein
MKKTKAAVEAIEQPTLKARVQDAIQTLCDAGAINWYAWCGAARADVMLTLEEDDNGNTALMVIDAHETEENGGEGEAYCFDINRDLYARIVADVPEMHEK